MGISLIIVKGISFLCKEIRIRDLISILTKMVNEIKERLDRIEKAINVL